jgi:DnaK suppressor protein
VAKKQTAKQAPQASTAGYDVLRERLDRQREEIHNLYNQDLRAGQESTDVGTEDIVDRANASYNRELMFSLSDGERQLLLQINDALRRMDDGTYGNCTNCSAAIAVPRLEALPWARFCINCQELAEKGMLEAEAG